MFNLTCLLWLPDGLEVSNNKNARGYMFRFLTPEQLGGLITKLSVFPFRCNDNKAGTLIPSDSRVLYYVIFKTVPSKFNGPI